MRQTATTGTQSNITSYDAFLRPTLVHQQPLSGGGRSIYTRTRYDALGRVVFASFPSESSTASTGTDTTYDALGRVTRTRENVTPFATTRTAYLSGNRVQVTDPVGNRTTTTRSGYASPNDGNPTSIAQPEGVTTAMSYDIYGNLLTATQGGKTQRWAYDSRLRLCAETTPETATTRYQYDNANQVTAYARGQAAGCGTLSSAERIANTYDPLGRVTAINYPGSTPDVSMSYDANGNLLTNNRGGANWTYTYDTTDQLLSETLKIDGRTYATSYTYNSNGAVTGQTTPGGLALTFAPNGHGQPTETRGAGIPFAHSAQYHANGLVREVLISEAPSRGLLVELNERQQPRLRHYYGHFCIFYEYDANGRMTESDYNYGHRVSAFGYDGVGRLKTASGPWGSGSFSYDTANNLTSKVLGSRRVTLSYNSLGRLSSARDTADGNISRSYGYDSRGNVTSNGRLSFVYDAANQPTSMSGSGISGAFSYDGNYRRVKQVINGETIYSVYGRGGQILYRDNASSGEATDFIRFGAMLVATRTGAEVEYQYVDHLGTPLRAVVNNKTVWEKIPTPYGETWFTNEPDTDQPGFTGHIEDTATGLTYMQARYYDPAIGRFLSADPVGFAQGGPAYFNRYAYAFNDPVNLIDPTGQSPEDPPNGNTSTNQPQVVDSSNVTISRRSGLNFSPIRGGITLREGTAQGGGFRHIIARHSPNSPRAAGATRDQGRFNANVLTDAKTFINEVVAPVVESGSLTGRGQTLDDGRVSLEFEGTVSSGDVGQATTQGGDTHDTNRVRLALAPDPSSSTGDFEVITAIPIPK